MNKKRFIKVIFASLFVLLFSSNLNADILHLKNGNEIEGKIVEETDKTVTLEIPGGKFGISRSDIEHIERKEFKAEIKGTTPAEVAEEKRTTPKDVAKRKTTIFAKVNEGIDSIHTNNYANTNLEYYYYIPSAIIKYRQKSYPLLIIIPPLSGRAEHYVTKKFKEFANEERFIIVAPSFIWDGKNWKSKRSYQYPSVWSGNALLEIIDKLKKTNDVKISKFYLFGFSAGAQFALRFCLWKPQLCEACAAHGSGGTVRPRRKINARFFVTVGTQDTLDRIKRAKEFYRLAQKYGINVVYREYDVGHSLTAAQIKDSLDFFKSLR